MKTLKDNWLWIALPILLFGLALAGLFFMGGDAEVPDDIYHLR